MIIQDDQLKDILLKTKIVDEKKFEEISEFAKNSGISLYDALIEKDIASDENLGILVADFLKIPFIALAKITIPEEAFRIVPQRYARKHHVIAFSRDDKSVKLAMSNPYDKEVLEMVARKTGLTVYAHFATQRDIEGTFHLFKRDLQKTFDQLLLEEIGRVGNKEAADAPIAKIVDLLIEYAYQDRSSDIHIEPQEKTSLVRFRIDGMLHDVLFIPKNLHDQIITRIKVLSRLRTDEHYSAQDGKMRLQLDEENLDIRVSILPIVEGEKVVLRLLASHFRQFSLLDLGMTEVDLQKVNNAMNKSYGMILSTGPTGAGKSTSIYAILKLLNKREKNITTIEDPVEYRIKGVNQIQVNPKTDLTFASGLRSILRQDPNIIFVGEIRDGETAGIAINAALTGHSVLSTLHTNDAATALPRFIDMKIEPFLVASTVNVIIAQRLIRKICDMCKASLMMSAAEIGRNIPPDVLKRNIGNSKDIRVYQGKGCRICHYTGYNGRIGVFEVLEVSKEIKRLIVEKADSDAIATQAVKDGMTTMLDDGLQKIIKGLTTIEEVLRVTKIETL